MDGCNDVWAADLDEEAKSLVRKVGPVETVRIFRSQLSSSLEVYQRDFDLICREFGYCNFGEATCLKGVPGMCPEGIFTWDDHLKVYVPKDA